MRAVLDGARQSIVDVELEARQSASRAERGIDRGGSEAENTLAREREQVRGYLNSLTTQMATAGHELDELATSGTGSKAD